MNLNEFIKKLNNNNQNEKFKVRFNFIKHNKIVYVDKKVDDQFNEAASINYNNHQLKLDYLMLNNLAIKAIIDLSKQKQTNLLFNDNNATINDIFYNKNIEEIFS